MPADLEAIEARDACAMSDAADLPRAHFHAAGDRRALLAEVRRLRGEGKPYSLDIEPYMIRDGRPGVWLARIGGRDCCGGLIIGQSESSEAELRSVLAARLRATAAALEASGAR